MDYLLKRWQMPQWLAKIFTSNEYLHLFNNYIARLIRSIKTIGYHESLGNYEKRKLGIFNLLNFLQLVTGIFIPIIGISQKHDFHLSTLIVSCLPVVASAIALYLNYKQQYQISLATYFALYPFLTSVVFINGINLGNELFFILYGVLSVFFIKDLWHMIFTIAFSMISYFVLTVLWNQRQYELATANLGMYRFNQALAACFIFYGLYLIKRENNSYQFSILRKNKSLKQKNIEIEEQKDLLAEKAHLLTHQKEELSELNALKNKLFSVIAHDLKTPMYGIRNLFRQIEHLQLSPAEMQRFVPEVVKDLNYTVSLMENLLQWSKTQMEAHVVQRRPVSVEQLIEEAVQLLHLQAAAKKIHIASTSNHSINVMADKEMISLVLRNLLSNAIKFTPAGGAITIGANACDSFVEIYVQDTGTGISQEALQMINQNNYFTTKGTASESGTGLGLMLCKDFLARSGGQIFIESEPGKGSTISFTLPLSEIHNN
jgi:signal transduction histidine kinase